MVFNQALSIYVTSFSNISYKDPLSTKPTEDRARQARGPVQLHKLATTIVLAAFKPFVTYINKCSFQNNISSISRTLHWLNTYTGRIQSHGVITRNFPKEILKFLGAPCLALAIKISLKLCWVIGHIKGEKVWIRGY